MIGPTVEKMSHGFTKLVIVCQQSGCSSEQHPELKNNNTVGIILIHLHFGLPITAIGQN